MKQTTAHKIMDLMDSEKPFVLFFKSQFCHYCQALEPAMEVLDKRYGDKIKLYTIDVNDEKAASDVFEDYFSGVPSVAIFCDDQFAFLDEPAEPDPFMWYTLDYLDNFIKKFLGE